jgi:hypothetical protein
MELTFTHGGQLNDQRHEWLGGLGYTSNALTYRLCLLEWPCTLPLTKEPARWRAIVEVTQKPVGVYGDS